MARYAWGWSLGKAAYEMRADGQPWAAIAAVLRLPERWAHKYADGYRRRQGLPGLPRCRGKDRKRCRFGAGEGRP